MKKTLLLFVMSFLFIELAHSQIKLGTSDGCVSMYGNAYIHHSGGEYYAYIKNECNKYVYIQKSKYTATFEYLYETSDDIKEKTQRKNIRFPGVFLAPGTSISKDRSRSDGSRRTYTDVLGQRAEMGSVYTCNTAKPTDNAIELKKGQQVYLGAKGTVKFYAIISTASDGWRGFTRYKVQLAAHNTSYTKAIVDAYINYNIYFHGVAFSGSLNMKKVKPNGWKYKSEREEAIFNFVPKMYINIKSTNIKLGEEPPSPAIVSATNNINADPNNDDLINKRGVLYYGEEKYEKALKDFIKASEINPKVETYWLNLAHTYIKLNNNTKARDSYSKAIEINPTSASHYYNRSYRHGDNTKSKLDDMKKACDLAPDNSNYIVNYGYAISISGGNKSEALRLINKGIELDPTFADAYWARGEVKTAMGDTEGAKQDYAKYNSLKD